MSGRAAQQPAGWILAAVLLLPPVLPSLTAQITSAAAANTPQRDAEVLRRLEADYLRAEVEDDTAIAGTILADDYVGLRPDGASSSKADVLARLGMRQRQREPYLITATNMREHLFGDTACVTYTKVYSKPGGRSTVSENVLHVLIRRNGIWRLQLSSPVLGARN